ncbi:sporulation-specific diadenylate cyclase CdaS [Laceyella putida]|uniref:Diadenylate cyclase n=1 Tax=Laceyella putida TaxID=110101 RepID=A0ABW2RF85_9BACL
MRAKDCDFSTLKAQLRQNLLAISDEIDRFLKLVDDEHNCLLGELRSLRNQIVLSEALASSFYLQCYLSPFTTKYLGLLSSIAHLSQRKHGVLIVVQRKDPLVAWLAHGTLIQAEFSSSLLESIFYPGSPLHDGAVLIKDDKIISAAHVLPLSNKEVEDDQKLGTRHRAALGLSEKCDAIVIVVSEETGRASFALNGKLYVIGTPT